jgi:hypothetical protein
VFGLIVFLGSVPIITLARTYYLNSKSDRAEHAMEITQVGTNKLQQINAGVYTVVMESRGIYMSPDWKKRRAICEWARTPPERYEEDRL